MGEYGTDGSQITQMESDVEDLETSWMAIPDGEYLDAECGLDSGYADSASRYSPSGMDTKPVSRFSTSDSACIVWLPSIP